MAEETNLNYTFDEAETKPVHVLPLPKGWIPVRCINIIETSGLKLNAEWNPPEIAGKFSKCVTFICEVPDQGLPPIDPMIQQQWEGQGYTVQWDKKLMLNFPMFLIDKDDNGNEIGTPIPDGRTSRSNQAHTERQETFDRWRKIGVPHTDIQITDPTTGQLTVKKQAAVSEFKNEYFVVELGAFRTGNDGRTFANVVDMMSVHQWQASHEVPGQGGVQVAAPVVEAAPVAAPALPVTATAPIATPPPIATPAIAGNGGDAGNPAASLFSNILKTPPQ